MLDIKNTLSVFRVLEKTYGKPKPPLKHKTAFQLLVAVILSAQCTDERVNKVTPKLFTIAPTPEKMIALGQNKLKKIIFSCGFYNTKSKNIIGMSKKLINEFKGKMPNTLEELKKLPGVATKSASVILSQWFKKPAFPVDTHVFRLAKRIGLAKGKTADTVYEELIKKVPEKIWNSGSLQLIFHGRAVCLARKPRCGKCALKHLCQYRHKT
jgi:endonuclease-3